MVAILHKSESAFILDFRGDRERLYELTYRKVEFTQKNEGFEVGTKGYFRWYSRAVECSFNRPIAKKSNMKSKLSQIVEMLSL